MEEGFKVTHLGGNMINLLGVELKVDTFCPFALETDEAFWFLNFWRMEGRPYVSKTFWSFLDHKICRNGRQISG